MWWKLVALALGTVALLIAIIPVRTKWVVWDPSKGPAPAADSLMTRFEAMYLTPDTAFAILMIVGLAGLAALKVIRRQW